MTPVLTIVDNFLIRPDEMRELVLSQPFRDIEHQGAVYKDVQPVEKYHVLPGLTDLFGREIKWYMGAWRRNSKGSQLHSLVHADNSCASMAAVLYLNPPEQCQGGTAFWKHKATGWESMPTEQQLKDAGMTLEEIAADWHKEDAWEMTTLAGMRFNRLITYPTTMFHSRWPWEGFGDSPEDSRLIGAFFFDLA